LWLSFGLVWFGLVWFVCVSALWGGAQAPSFVMAHARLVRLVWWIHCDCSLLFCSVLFCSVLCCVAPHRTVLLALLSAFPRPPPPISFIHSFRQYSTACASHPAPTCGGTPRSIWTTTPPLFRRLHRNTCLWSGDPDHRRKPPPPPPGCDRAPYRTVVPYSMMGTVIVRDTSNLGHARSTYNSLPYHIEVQRGETTRIVH